MLLTMKQDDSPYYTHLRELNLSPGWARPEPSMWPSPQPKFKPAVWRFAQKNLSGRAAVIAVLEDWPAICSVVVAVGSMIMIGIMLYNDWQQ